VISIPHAGKHFTSLSIENLGLVSELFPGVRDIREAYAAITFRETGVFERVSGHGYFHRQITTLIPRSVTKFL
jgi:hypothetical protein